MPALASTPIGSVSQDRDGPTADDTASSLSEGPIRVRAMAGGVPRRAAGPKDLLQHNRAQSLQALLAIGSMNRNHLVQATGLASPTVFRLVDEWERPAS